MRNLLPSTPRQRLHQLLLASLLVVPLAVIAATPGGWDTPAAKGKRILYFTKSSGFEHSVIQRPAANELSHSERILSELGRRHGFAVDCSKDGSLFSTDQIARYDVFVFYTSGLLTEVGTDKHPAMTPAGKSALLEAIRNGKGFVGLHSANDSFHIQPDPPDLSTRFVAHGEGADPYIRMLGGEFIRHGPQQVARLRLVHPKFPGCESLPEPFEIQEEWYTFKDFAPDLHVIQVLETKGMKGIDYQRAPFPYTWARRHGQGRVFYTGLAHREDVWAHPHFQSILLGGLGWAAKNVDADVAPNIATATPGYRELQPKDEPK